jgi:hypothetical protein
MAKSMAERMKDHHAKRKREWAELQAERDALREEVAELRRQLAERTDPPAAQTDSSIIDEIDDSYMDHADNDQEREAMRAK